MIARLCRNPQEHATLTWPDSGTDNLVDTFHKIWEKRYPSKLDEVPYGVGNTFGQPVSNLCMFLS
jgi:hypothetical protein